MKKLSILIAILLIATIGGVYATWNYVGTTTDIGIEHGQAIKLENSVLDGPAGSYGFDCNITALSIAPNNQTDKIATLVPTYSGGDAAPKLTITFTPSAHCGDDIELNGIDTYIYFDFEREFKYEGDDIFTIEHGANKALKISKINGTGDYDYVWTKDGSNFKIEIDDLALADIIALSQDFQLIDIDAYNNFLVGLGNSHTISLHMHIENINPKVS